MRREIKELSEQFHFYRHFHKALGSQLLSVSWSFSESKILVSELSSFFQSSQPFFENFQASFRVLKLFQKLSTSFQTFFQNVNLHEELLSFLRNFQASLKASKLEYYPKLPLKLTESNISPSGFRSKHLNCLQFFFIISWHAGWARRNEKKLSPSIKRTESTKSQNKQFINFIAKTIFLGSSAAESRDFFSTFAILEKVTGRKWSNYDGIGEKEAARCVFREEIILLLPSRQGAFCHGLVVLLKNFPRILILIFSRSLRDFHMIDLIFRSMKFENFIKLCGTNCSTRVPCVDL
jgi:hypothetical protein